MTTTRIATASAEERPSVVGEEAGGWLGGAGGAALLGAGCIALGIASGGIVLGLCGLAGGLGGGLLGAWAGGALGEKLGRQ